jgi:hypothetical protein
LLQPLNEIINNKVTEESRKKLELTLTELIVKSLANGSKTKDGVIYEVTRNLINKVKNGELITNDDINSNPFSISDP